MINLPWLITGLPNQHIGNGTRLAEKVTIRIQPSGGASVALTVEDAMQQVLDFIDMLRAADLSQGGEKIVWRLERAQTNSPLEVTAFATGPDPSVSVAYQARQTAERLSKAIATLEYGGLVPDWMDDQATRTAERFFKRNMNGIGRTDIWINDDEPTIIVHSSAKVAALSIERSRIEDQLEQPDWTRSEMGSVEGEVLSTTSIHTKPAIVIKERLSGQKINCILSDELAEKIGPNHSWDETWEQRRFLISGELHFGSEGALKKVDALSMVEIRPTPVDLDKLRDLEIGTGNTPNAMHERLWGDG